jgi:hypothetical protein
LGWLAGSLTVVAVALAGLSTAVWPRQKAPDAQMNPKKACAAWTSDDPFEG